MSETLSPTATTEEAQVFRRETLDRLVENIRCVGGTSIRMAFDDPQGWERHNATVDDEHEILGARIQQYEEWCEQNPEIREAIG